MPPNAPPYTFRAFAILQTEKKKKKASGFLSEAPHLELLAVHGGDVSLLADSEGIGHGLPGGLGGHHEGAALLRDLRHRLDVLGHLDDIIGEFW